MSRFPTPHEMLALNRALPDALRDRSVAIEFQKPIPKHVTESFYRIRLSRKMLAGGEEDFFMPEIAQPHRVGRQVCPTCGRDMQRISLTTYRCENTFCFQGDGTPSQSMAHISGPNRGVVSVRTEFAGWMQGREVDVSFLCGYETKDFQGRVLKVPIVRGCLLVLDRRYPPEVLAAVYRTAGILCEHLREEGIDVAIK